MGRIAEVLSVERTTTPEGAPVVNVVMDPGGGANVTAEHFADSGDDSPPLAGDFAALEPSAGTGTSRVTGYADTKNASKAKDGEKRLYSRKPDGTPAAEIWAKADGTVVIQGLLGGGKLELGTDGTFDINGVKITKSGEIKAPGEVSAMTATAAVKLSTHLHPTGMGPSGPPTPG